MIPTPKIARTKQSNVSPTAPMMARTIQGHESKRMLKVLLDSGGTKTMIHEKCLPPGATPALLTSGSQRFRTTAGEFTTNRSVHCKDVILPEFDETRRVDGIECFVFNQPCRYDIILGVDFLVKAGIQLDFEKQVIKWFDDTIPMKTFEYWQNSENAMATMNMLPTHDDEEETAEE